MKCPKCNSEKVRSYDNQPIFHPEKKDIQNGLGNYRTMGIDYEIYISIICDDCEHRFERNFPIVKDYTNADNEALNIILDSLDPDSILEKSLKKVIQTLGHVKNNSDICIQPIKKETMKDEAKVLDIAISDIERWKGDAYQPDDEVGLAIEEIKKVSASLKTQVKPEPVNALDYDVREVLKSLEVIESSKELSAELRKEYGTDFAMIKACIKDNFVKPEAIVLINRIAPICYKIGNKVFLKGETKGEHDLIGDDMDFQPVTELFDMTTEMDTGDSYSFYVSSVDNFDLASSDEIIKVKKFLNNW
jgi:hypothetical protein